MTTSLSLSSQVFVHSTDGIMAARCATRQQLLCRYGLEHFDLFDSATYSHFFYSEKRHYMYMYMQFVFQFAQQEQYIN